MNNFLITPTWFWLITAILLLILELLKTNGYTLWLSISAALIALITSYFPAFILLYQVLSFTVLAIVLCFWWYHSLKRKPLQLQTLKAKKYLGCVYTLEKPIKGGRGQLEIDHAIWFIYSESDLAKGSRIKVKGHNGVILLVEKYLD